MVPTFEHDSLTFNYIDTGEPDGRPFVLQHGMGRELLDHSSASPWPWRSAELANLESSA